MACVMALTLCAPRALRNDLRAQTPPRAQIPGMPDMSSAPADVQAIWNKLIGGGRPTQAEAKRLSDWMNANKDKVAAATTKGLQGQQQAMGGPGLGGHDGQPACPTKVVLPASLAVIPTAAGAAALLDSLKASYTARLTPDGAKLIEKLVTQVTDPAQLNAAAGTLLMKHDVAASVVVYTGEVSRAKGTAVGGAWTDLGAALIADNNWMQAVRALRYALFVGGRVAPGVTDLGVAYADLGDLQTATTLFTEATRLSPHWSQAWDALGRVESCTGNMIGAGHSLAKAQEDDWSASRQDDIDKVDQAKANADQASDDPAVEAAKPIPMPPGPSPFPAPPAGGSPGYFAAWAPKLGDTWEAQAAAQVYFTQMATTFRQLSGQILAQRAKSAVTQTPGVGAKGGLVVIFALGNGAQATAAAQLVDDRTSARMTMMVNQWAYADSLALANGAMAARPVQAKYQSCESVTRSQDLPVKCLAPWCRGMTGVVAQIFAAREGAARVLIGGEEGLSGTYSKAMNAWFDWAGEPDTRQDIDQTRRAKLASMEAMAYNVAAQAQAAPPEECANLPEALARLAKAEADATRNAGECRSVSIHIPLFATMEADCHRMIMSADILSDYIGDLGTPTFEIQRASATQNGKFFIGISREASDGIGLSSVSASASAGLQVTWDNAGWVQSSGGAIHGEAGGAANIPGVDASAHVSGDLLISGRQTGPAASGSVGAGATLSGPGVNFAPSVNFGGQLGR